MNAQTDVLENLISGTCLSGRGGYAVIINAAGYYHWSVVEGVRAKCNAALCLCTRG
jgi:hypothetical protein